MAESAIWPRVRLVIVSIASSADSKAWVAPSSIAFSRLLGGSGSMAMTFFAPARAAPWTR